MYLIQTVQTSWRPQLPLPKESQLTDVHCKNDDEQQQKHAVNSNRNPLPTSNNDIDEILTEDMERLRKDNNNSALSGGTQQHTGKQKWSFGRLFRRKKEVETESSSEEDRKAGFVPAQKYPRNDNGNGNGNSNGTGSVNIAKPKAKHKSNRAGHSNATQIQQQQQQQTSQQVKANHQHIDNEFFLPVETISPTEPYYQNQQLQPHHHHHQHQQQPPYIHAPHAQQPQLQQNSRSSNSLDRRAMAVAQQARGCGNMDANVHKSRSAQRLPHGVGIGPHSSSEEGEIISLNSSTFSKYRSDESIHSGGQALQPGQSRRSRAARNERYYKRLSRDGEPSHGQVPIMYAHAPTQRWKTQPVPLSIYQAPHQRAANPAQHEPQRLRNTSSLQNVTPYVQWNQMQQQLQQQQEHQQQQQQHHQQQPQLNINKGGLQNTVSDAKRSISYDSHIHLQNANGRMLTKPLPPPPPPRDPLRRVNVSAQSLQNGSSGDLRPVSYAFDQCGVPVLPSTTPPRNASAQAMLGLGGRCVSDDRIWQPQMPHYQSVHSLNIQPQPTPSTRRYISRAERDANPAKKSLPNGIDFRYIADAMPRSRKPIHMLEHASESLDLLDAPASSGILRTSKSGLPTMAAAAPSASEFWQRLDENTAQRTSARGHDSARTEPIPKPRSISSSRAGEMRSYPIPMYSEVQKPKNRAQPPQPNLGIDTVDNVICGSLHIKPGANNGDNYVEMRHKDLNKSQSMPHQYQRSSGGTPTTPNKYDEYVAEKREQHAQAPIFPSSLPNSSPMPPQRKASEPQIYFPRKKPANLEEAINELEAIYKSLGLTEPPEKRERVPTPSDFERFALAHADEYDDDDSPTGEPDPVRDDVAYRNLQLANLQYKSSEKQPPFGIPIGPIVPAPQSDYLHVMPEQLKKKTTGSPDIIKDDLAVRALRKDPPGPKLQFSYPIGALQHKKNRATRTQSANIYNLIHRDAAKPSGGDMYSYMELTRSIDRAGSMSDIHKGEPITDIPATLDLLRKLKAEDKEEEMNHHYNNNNGKKAHVPFRHPSRGGAICQLPERLTSSVVAEVHKAPVPLPRKSLTPEPHLLGHNQMEDVLNKIAQEAQESSIKLSKELQELRKEALITAARPKLNPEEEKLELDLQEIEAVSEAAKRCGKMLLDTLPDVRENVTETSPKPPRKLHKEGKLIKAIDQVSEAANAVCEKILKDIVTTEPTPAAIQEVAKPQLAGQKTTGALTANKEEPELVTPQLLKKIDPLHSDNIEKIAKRCMRQLSELAEAESADYDNLAQSTTKEQTSTAVACNMPDTKKASDAVSIAHPNLISTIAEVHRQPQSLPHDSKRQTLDEIDKIMQECEAQARNTKPQSHVSSATPDEQRTTAPSMTSSSASGSGSASAGAGGKAATNVNASTTASSFSSSSDCLAKSSSPTNASRRQSSSITSFNPYSSSDYIKSPSSDCHTVSTDPIKTFSTTSYDVQSTKSNSQHNTSGSTAHTTANSTFSYTPSPSPPLNLTPVSARRSNTAERARSSSPSQYNSSEELAMIFGIEEKPKQRNKLQQQQQQQQITEAIGSHQSDLVHTNKTAISDLSSESATANTSCQQQQQKQEKPNTQRYSGHHPHFHHHAAPAYYTDENLHIHTPNAADVAALNENYQSVYRTPSKLVGGERYFPKTATATVAPPPIGTGVTTASTATTATTTAANRITSSKLKSPIRGYTTSNNNNNNSVTRSAFFRGDAAAIGEPQKVNAAHYAKLSPTYATPTKGEEQQQQEQQKEQVKPFLDASLTPAPAPAPEIVTNASLVFAFKPTTVEAGVGVATTTTTTTTSTTTLDDNRELPTTSPNRSRNQQRFGNRKRAVRVRSESRPISALYDIICKEKGLDIGTTTTNDEDSSPTHSRQGDYDNEFNAVHQPKYRQIQQSLDAMSRNLGSPSLLTHPGANYDAAPNSGASSASGSKRTKATRRKQKHNQHARSDEDDDDEGDYALTRLRATSQQPTQQQQQQKPKINSSNFYGDTSPSSKAASLPPALLAHSNNHHAQRHQHKNLYLHHHPHQNHEHAHEHDHEHEHRQSYYKEADDSVPQTHQFNSEHYQPNLRMISNGASYKVKAAGSVDTLHTIDPADALSSSTIATTTAKTTANTMSPVNSRLSQRRLDAKRYHTADGMLLSYAAADNVAPLPTKQTAEKAEEQALLHAACASSQPAEQLNGIGGSNARRYINRPSRTANRQGSNGATHAGRTSPYHSDSTSPSPQRPQKRASPPPRSPAHSAATAAAAAGSSANGNSSAYETAATSVMTHSATPPVEVPASAAASNSSATVNALATGITDKKKEEGLQQQQQQQRQRYSSPTSPRHQYTAAGAAARRSSYSDTQKSPSASGGDLPSPSPLTPAALKRLMVPTVSVSMKQNLSEMHFTSGGGGGGAVASPTTPTSPGGKQAPPIRNINSDDCTVKLSPRAQHRQHGGLAQTKPAVGHADALLSNAIAMRPRSSTMQATDSNAIRRNNEALTTLELSPVPKNRRTPEASPRRNGNVPRDKSSKRKSNLNRSLHEEPTLDGDNSLSARRRRRRELGMARPLVPGDDAALREWLQSTQKASTASVSSEYSKSGSPRSELAMHMENARRGLDLLTTSAETERRRAQTASPNKEVYSTVTKVYSATPGKAANGSNGGNGGSGARVSRRSDTLPLNAMRRLRTDDVNQKFNERTKTDLAEIMKIAEQAQAADEEQSESPLLSADTVEGFGLAEGGQEAILKLSPILRRKSTDEPNAAAPAAFSAANTLGMGSSMSTPNATANTSGGSCGQANASPSSVHNQIVSILKKKDHGIGESSSASSNASPVTFSANVVDTPIKHKRAGILKKRSSLDESRYYSRSHSPDERSILIKSARRNSLEEIGATGGGSQTQLQQQQQHSTHQQHGILKQSSYDSSKSDGCPSATETHPHSILKKKDSTSTPSDGGSHAPKHVSISQAVILAAAELGRDADEVEHDADILTPSNEEYDLRPILKQESTSSEENARPPKPILKKKSSGDSDELEIRPILKTSRKSSREEFDLNGGGAQSGGDSGEGTPSVRPILKTDSPSKRRSLGMEPDFEFVPMSPSPGLLKRRTRSLERQDGMPVIDLGAALNAIATSHSSPAPVDFVTTPASVSVAERIRNMETFLINQTTPTTPTSSNAANISWESPLQARVPECSVSGHIAIPKVFKPSVIRRDLYRDRYKTQPVTHDEMSFFKATSSPFDISSTSAFKPTKPIDFGHHPFASQTLHRSTNNVGPAATPALSSPLVGSVHYTPVSATSTAANALGGFRLTRSQTQPLQTARVATSRLAALPQTDHTLSDLSRTLSIGSDSEQIFYMSGLDEDSAMQSHGDDASASASAVAGGGVARSSSVRARANMFQQLQEQTRNKREAAGEPSTQRTTGASRHPGSRRSPPPPAMAHSSTPNDEPNSAQDTDEEVAKSAPEPLKGILKTKPPGGVALPGLMPIDLNAELKNRLKRSTHATVSNLRKSATSSDASKDRDAPDGNNLARILRSVSSHPPKENAPAVSEPLTTRHSDTVNLVRNLSNLGRPRGQTAEKGGKAADGEAAGANASASEGESSGGREVSAIIKNSAVARRRRQHNDGLMMNSFLTKVKPVQKTYYWPYQLHL